VSGRSLDDLEPGFTQKYFDVQHEFLRLLDPTNMPPLDTFPFLAYLPAFLAPWKKSAARVHDATYGVYNGNLAAAKKSLAQGRHESFEPALTYMLREREADTKLSMPDDEVRLMAGGLVDAGVDTTWAALTSVMLCLTAHPAVMKRAQAEIDEVCGSRCPGVQDIDRLPFVTACMLETFRWRSVAQAGLPHLTTEDDVFEGYTIPKGTTVLACSYYFHLRPDDYERPDEFDPERYMQNRYGVRSSASDAEEWRKETYMFGVGRRICPAEDYTKHNIFLMMAKLMWAFDFEIDGEPDLAWETGYTPGLSNAPRDFNPRVKLRRAKMADEIEAEFARSERYLAESG
jgi:cytochrome P450